MALVRKKSVTKANMSVKWFRDNGYLCEPTEQTIRYPNKLKPGTMTVFKRDLWNAFDGVAVKIAGDEHGITLFQATVGMNNKGERQQKIELSPATVPLLRCGNTIELHIWRKMGKKGDRKLWKLARFEARAFPVTPHEGSSCGIQWLDISETEMEETCESLF